ncbi:MAG: hypothetical protein V3T02_07145 [Alphaproteobacteria bacterium]
MAAEPEGTGSQASPDKLSVVVFSGDFHRIHYALAMAAAAAAVNRPVTLFFTMGAIRALGKAAPGGAPGWHDTPVTPGIADGCATAEAADGQFASRGIASFDELLSACISFEVKFMVCEMGLRAVDMTVADLRRDITYTEGGIVSFLADASNHGATILV